MTMKVLVSRTTLSSALAVSLADALNHIRQNEGEDDQAVTNMIKTATAELEQFAQIALLTQTIRVNIFDPPQHWSSYSLPIGPVADDDVPTITIDGSAFTGFAFVGGARPYIRWQASYLDLPCPDRITIEYQAGFGATAADIPPDLAQAVMDQALLHYDARSPMDDKSLTTSPHMARIGARYRGVKA